MNYKAVIVDNNPLTVQALVQTIDWKGLCVRVVGYAENGQEAKSLIDRSSPELLITDIKMPGMNGLELTEYVKSRLPDTQIIMITGYQEFEYARKALSLGVSDLVLKPVKNEILEEKIQKAILELEKKKRVARIVHNSREALQEQFLHRLLKERGTEEAAFWEQIKEFDFYQKDYYLILFRMRSRQVMDEKIGQEMVILWLKERKKTRSWDVYEWISGKNQIIIIFENEKQSARERKVRLQEGLLALSSDIQKKCRSSCQFVVSRTSNDLRNLPVCYRQTLEIIENSYFNTEQTLLFSDSWSSPAISEKNHFIHSLERFCQSIGQFDQRQAQAQAEELLNDLFDETAGDEFRVKCLLSEICLTLLRRSGLEENTNQLLEEISSLTGKEACRLFLNKFSRKIEQQLEEKQEYTNPLIRESISYIHEHYMENLSLTNLAEIMSVNASYLSRLFKKETGKNFSDILTECRINQAKFLLEQPGSRVIDVCEQVGYSDYTYFYQVFKKTENLSPSEYKKVKKTNI